MKFQFHLKAILFIACHILINNTCFAVNDIGKWRHRTSQITTDPSVPDSLKVIRISDLTYNYFYYYRAFDETYLDEYLKIVEPFTRNKSENDLFSYIYSTTVVITKNTALKKEMSDKCIFYTEKCSNPLISAQSWERLGRAYFSEATGLNFYFRGLNAIERLDAYAVRSDIYKYISFYYSNQGDTKNQIKYAESALKEATKSNSPRHIMHALDALAGACYLTNDIQAAIEKYNEARNIYLEKIKPAEQDADMRYVDNAHYMVILVNLGSMYYYKGELRMATQLMNEALRIARASNIVETEAYCHKELGRIYIEMEEYIKAEEHFLKTEELLAGDYVSTMESEYIDYEIKLALAGLYKTKGDYKKAADYYKTGIAKYRSLHDEEQQAQNQQLAASYETKIQEEAIARMKTIITYEERQKYLYSGILLAILLTSFLVIRLFRDRIMLVEQKEQNLCDKARVLEYEKRRMELEGLLKQSEADSLKQKLTVSNDLLKQRSRTLKEVTAFLEENPDLTRFQNELKSIILLQNRIESNVEDIKLGMRNVPLDFYPLLQKQANNKLTPLDLKYCRLIYLETSSKKIADLLSVEPKTVRMNKYRLKQKLNLAKEDDLNQFIRNIANTPTHPV